MRVSDLGAIIPFCGRLSGRIPPWEDLMHRKFQQRRDSALGSGGRTAAQHIFDRAGRQVVALLERKHSPVFPADRCLDVFLMQGVRPLVPFVGRAARFGDGNVA